ncbi:hypothetical protein BJY00DRAFT_309728 [Aspergillus carlsbadensis]|nr:hypothetical protein BJY00DRAFT_309728 [Aspergillus carlsbadensis]
MASLVCLVFVKDDTLVNPLLSINSATHGTPLIPAIRRFSTLSPILSVGSISCTSSPALSVPPGTPTSSSAATISPLLVHFPSPPNGKGKEKYDQRYSANNTFQLPYRAKKIPAHIIPLPNATLAAETLASAFSCFPADPHLPVPRTACPTPRVNVPRQTKLADTGKNKNKAKNRKAAAYTTLVKAHILTDGLVISTGGDEGKPTHDAVALLLPPGAGPRVLPPPSSSSSGRGSGRGRGRARNLTKGWGWRVYLRSGMWKGAVKEKLDRIPRFGLGNKPGCHVLSGLRETGNGRKEDAFEGIDLDPDVRFMKARMAAVMGFQAEETWMLTALGTKVGSRPFGLGGRALEVCCDMVDAREKPLYTECFEYNVRFFEKYGFHKMGLVAMNPVEKGVILNMMVREPDLSRFRDSGDDVV